MKRMVWKKTPILIMFLMKDIEHVVKNANNTWKNIYLLHKQSDFPINVSDKDEDDDE